MEMRFYRSVFILAVLMLAAFAVTVSAQDMTMTPSVTVSDQLSLDGEVVVDEIWSDGPGFIVIHADSDGAPGPVIGYRQINDGASQGVAVDIDPRQATPTLHAMLHVDTGEVGVYEFGQVEGADVPVRVDDVVVNVPFNVELVRAYDQLLENDTVTIDAVVASENGFIVVHADGGGQPGPVLGFAQIAEGGNFDVAVDLEGDITGVLYPMLHVDTGEEGVYEFGQVEGADGPVVVDGRVATFPIETGSPSMRVPDQIVTDTVVAESVVSDGPGWLVIHADGGGSPGPVIGFAAVDDGLNVDVSVDVDAENVTPVLYPMLHVDTGEEGTYEFGQVEGADSPVMIDGSVLTFPIDAAPSITYSGMISGATVTVDAALIDTQGWLVIHADDDGSPGAVLGYAPLVPGLNEDVSVELSADGITETLYPMLHVDTGEVGVYEFGQVEGADTPIRVNDMVVTGPMQPDEMD